MPKVPGVQTGIVSGLLFGSPGKKMPFRCSLRKELQRTPERWGVAAPSNIRKVQIVQGGKVVAPNGGTVLLENVQMEPFLPKG
jgi:hypothetical protein